jgi:hypothetical protein
MWCVVFVLVNSVCDVVFVSVLRTLYIFGVESGVGIFPMSVGLVASVWPAATVGGVPTVFVC